ncbi:hypothetical protein GR160_10685 [Flavobacterium sp. Sd200]|uniref:hypothetical protein n=1 Tax=Flavobacterium sp. Sd200 TaxID=2692211 RepID=UPI0013708AC2|nr:hypothetical protein [Flavobacterium sp. Sd200]MXN91692.1 hypothetical protein [Flavobacterium sp. Sd200]
MKFSIKNLVPIAAMAIATIGAYATQHTSESPTAFITYADGFVKGNDLGTVCNNSTRCMVDDGPICTVTASGPNFGQQLWGKTAAGRCTVELHKIP